MRLNASKYGLMSPDLNIKSYNLITVIVKDDMDSDTHYAKCLFLSS